MHSAEMDSFTRLCRCFLARPSNGANVITPLALVIRKGCIHLCQAREGPACPPQETISTFTHN